MSFWRSCRQFRMAQFRLRWRPRTLNISRRPCVNFTGCLFVSTSSANWQWWFSSAYMDWRLHTSLMTLCLSPHPTASDISGLLSLVALLSLDITLQLVQEALQSPLPKYGTVFRPTYVFTDSHYRHLDRACNITCLWTMSASEDVSSCAI